MEENIYKLLNHTDNSFSFLNLKQSESINSINFLNDDVQEENTINHELINLLHSNDKKFFEFSNFEKYESFVKNLNNKQTSPSKKVESFDLNLNETKRNEIPFSKEEFNSKENNETTTKALTKDTENVQLKEIECDKRIYQKEFFDNIFCLNNSSINSIDKIDENQDEAKEEKKEVQEHEEKCKDYFNFSFFSFLIYLIFLFY